MPLNYLSNSYGNMLASQGIGSSIAGIANQRKMLPYLQLQLQLRQQALQNQAMLNAAHESLYQAQSQHAKASALLATQQAEKLRRDMELSAKLGAAMRGPQPTDWAPTRKNAEALRQGDILDYTSQIATRAPQDIAKQVLQLQQPRDVQAMVATGSHFSTAPERPVALAPGYQLFSPQGGAPIASNTQARPSTGLTPEDRYNQQYNQLIDAVAKSLAAAITQNTMGPVSPTNYAPVLNMTNLLRWAQGPPVAAPQAPVPAADNDPLGLFK